MTWQAQTCFCDPNGAELPEMSRWETGLDRGPKCLERSISARTCYKSLPRHKGVVQDADIRTCVGLPAVTVTPGPQKRVTAPPTTILHRDVRRLVVLLPVEEQ